ncbi:unnamed protein product [Trypanosoma congolense IL3000]|jgi:predicted house-cleaning NTP pyrophosphatase (Maf/HAM1 superfamily)|uniref:WGS project CAEQ00000000 data, annotated contig 1792 n=1 Tax=Trypanosoma congolense (strain IL3000) TaxID=1068625 RepID=F9W8X4_TRYCI|nr:unnamed protein product [Trypanosoma congolense IL3000]
MYLQQIVNTMSIKNWIVTTERVKNKSEGLSEYSSYLVSSKHKNHKNTTIIPLFKIDYNNFINKTILETIEFDSKNKKGGRKVESYAQSFNFILPPPHKPTISQWENITKDLLVTLCNELNIKEKTKFGKSCFMNIHDQSNPHLNLLVPRIFDGERLADLDRKNVLAKLKLQFNQSVMKHCEIDHTKHKPLRSNNGPRKSAQRYAYDKAKEQAENALKLIAEAGEATKEVALAEGEIKVKLEELDKVEKELKIQNQRLGFLINAYTKFKDTIFSWANSARKGLTLETMIHRQELEKNANAIIDSKFVSDKDAFLVEQTVLREFEELEKDGIETVKPEISSRLTKIKAS